MDRKLGISKGASRLTPKIKCGKVGWEALAKKLLDFKINDISYDEYMAFDRDQQSEYKDVGYFIGGYFSGDSRKKSELVARSVITLDIDHLDPFDLPEVEGVYGEYEYILHSTHKHNDLDPRLRLVFPLAEDCTPEQYEPIARKLAEKLDMDIFDDTTFQPARIMFWPARAKGGDVVAEHNKGVWISPKKILAEYEDWQDFVRWPHSSRVKVLTHGGVKEAEDPLSKPGIIGRFCRQFDIHAAISRFELPYETTAHDNRYRPVNSTGAAGSVVYDEVFMFSHHENDPVGGMNVNAWDLVRIHKFGDFEEDEMDDPIMERESSKLMSALALALPELDENLSDEMEVIDEGEPKKKKKPKLTFDVIAQEVRDLDVYATSPNEALKAITPRIAAAKLTKSENSILASMIKDRYKDSGVSKSDVLADVKEQSKKLVGQIADGDELIDLEYALIDETLKTYYAKGEHIKRIGRQFWAYDGGVWLPISDEHVRGKVQRTLIQLRKDRPEEVMDLVAVVGDNKTSTLANALWSLITSELATREDSNDPLNLLRHFMPPVINCKNGEIWFKNDGSYTFRKHTPAQFFTTQVQTEYDPDAECPEWDKFMRMIWQDSANPKEMIRHTEELGGYLMQMSRWLKTWVLFFGAKDAGKSTVSQTFSLLLGDSVEESALSSFDGKNSHAESSLVGKLLLLDDDFDKGAVLPDGFIKKISEEKAITANPKNKDKFKFVSRALPMVCSNHWPVTRDVTDAFVERALVFHFNHRITASERDDKVKEHMLRYERPGILNRFIAGFSRLRERGCWSIPNDSTQAHTEWQHNSNPVYMFANEILDDDKHNIIKANDLWVAYRSWSQDNNPRGGMLKRNEFYDRLDRIMGPRLTEDGQYAYKGKAFKDSDDI